MPPPQDTTYSVRYILDNQNFSHAYVHLEMTGPEGTVDTVRGFYPEGSPLGPGEVRDDAARLEAALDDPSVTLIETTPLALTSDQYDRALDTVTSWESNPPIYLVEDFGMEVGTANCFDLPEAVNDAISGPESPNVSTQFSSGDLERVGHVGDHVQRMDQGLFAERADEFQQAFENFTADPTSNTISSPSLPDDGF